MYLLALDPSSYLRELGDHIIDDYHGLSYSSPIHAKRQHSEQYPLQLKIKKY